ncbi:dihydrofolate reductase family protein [Pseudoalteromonas luteoviolacea]|uniref:dihydrofolate reductase family protein n=1 Tax=Pseudoalteromonas luteoviolacea TaxID=43657 RepID=UPI001B37C5D0|nr:dihydrofolate reductase family protein [Pseudoalteromonas luteoviolacea]MBQ4838054.1 dihydrofolate reductase [Pseudoalteromonas luteoviolacea]
MSKKNTVYLAQSLDGFIADQQGNIDWLSKIDNPNHSDLGFGAFMADIDAIVMGRNTFDQVMKYGQWPYDKPVFVLSKSLKQLPQQSKGKAYLVCASEREVIAQLHQLGHDRLYIDGGKLVQNFLSQGLIDEAIVITVPVVLGKGLKWLPEQPLNCKISLLATSVLLGELVQSHYQIESR